MNTSIFDRSSSTGRLVRLIRLARRALAVYQLAATAQAEAATAIHYCPDCARAAGSRARHTQRRYLALETQLAEMTGLPAFSVFNDLSRGICTRLMEGGAR